MFIEIINMPSYTPKEAFEHLSGKLGEIPNQRKETISRDIIQRLN